MTRSLSSDIEEQERAEIGEKARVLPAEVRNALAVLEVEVDLDDSRYRRPLHRQVIKSLVQPGTTYRAPAKTSPQQGNHWYYQAACGLLLGALLIDAGIRYWPLLRDLL